MDMTHLSPFLDAMHRCDPDGLAQHMSDDVVLRSPILEAPFQGKNAVLNVLRVLLRAADDFETTNIIAAERTAAVFVTIRAGEVTVDGIDEMHVDQAGFISSMTIQWRPLPAIVAMQQRIAPLIGMSPMRLVEA